MKLRPAQRREALAKMGNGYQKQMFLLGLRCKALEHEQISSEQKRRLESELLPAIRRVHENQQKRNKRGLLAIQIQQATSIFADIFGADWHPRPDNPVQRECMADLQTSL
ncbi:hypothetical protein PP494_gp66 [Gordonia phage Matteo]|uniref:Uncharacterized protein n=1 Tax=Gordonia phage Matteo TaxID=2759392 RepID=A0A7L7SI88_9CAUD|nr:hypothetical protein PP494_gp66 [Gordonia phage Matteo]QOC55996.1 hypothetical protein SEA_MATTEO_66 [Gordonia phage Matteo]